MGYIGYLGKGRIIMRHFFGERGMSLISLSVSVASSACVFSGNAY